jgi:hypothetical protein
MDAFPPGIQIRQTVWEGEKAWPTAPESGAEVGARLNSSPDVKRLRTELKWAAYSRRRPRSQNLPQLYQISTRVYTSIKVPWHIQPSLGAADTKHGLYTVSSPFVDPPSYQVSHPRHHSSGCKYSLCDELASPIKENLHCVLAFLHLRCQ